MSEPRWFVSQQGVPINVGGNSFTTEDQARKNALHLAQTYEKVYVVHKVERVGSARPRTVTEVRWCENVPEPEE